MNRQGKEEVEDVAALDTLFGKWFLPSGVQKHNRNEILAAKDGDKTLENLSTGHVNITETNLKHNLSPS